MHRHLSFCLAHHRLWLIVVIMLPTITTAQQAQLKILASHHIVPPIPLSTIHLAFLTTTLSPHHNSPTSPSSSHSYNSRQHCHHTSSSLPVAAIPISNDDETLDLRSYLDASIALSILVAMNTRSSMKTLRFSIAIESFLNMKSIEFQIKDTQPISSIGDAILERMAMNKSSSRKTLTFSIEID